MSEKFEASNGVTVRFHDTTVGQRTSVYDPSPAQHPAYPVLSSQETYLDSRQHDALREFFQHERDEELGRWRWPENPDYVVYPVGSGSVVNVMKETNGHCSQFERGDRQGFGFGLKTLDPSYTDAANAYFDAHPEPKPWEDAKPGEVWLITAADVTRPYIATTYGTFDEPTCEYSISDTTITAGRRIYPEGESDE